MKILIRSIISLILASFLVGCTPEIVIRTVVLLVLLSTLIKYAQAVLSTPSPAEALSPAIDNASSHRADEVYQPKNDLRDFADVADAPCFTCIPITTYSYV